MNENLLRIENPGELPTSVPSAHQQDPLGDSRTLTNLSQNADYYQLKPLVEERYSLGELFAIKRKAGGFRNDSFSVTVREGSTTRDFFMRRYMQGAQLPDIDLEHALHIHLETKHQERKHVYGISDGGEKVTRLVAKLIETPNRSTLVEQDGRYYAIFSALRGGDSRFGSWASNECTPVEQESAARLLARFRADTRDFTWHHQGLPEYRDQLKDFPAKFAKFADIPIASSQEGTNFQKYFIDSLDRVLAELQKTNMELSNATYDHLPRGILHNDWHPANLMWGNMGAFHCCDLEMAGFGPFMQDLGNAIGYFARAWAKEDSGQLNLLRVGRFMSAFSHELSLQSDNVPNNLECRVLPTFIQAGNLSLLDWALSSVYEHAAAPGAYLPYLKHSLNAVLWLAEDANRAAVGKVLGEGLAEARLRIEQDMN